MSPARPPIGDAYFRQNRELQQMGGMARVSCIFLRVSSQTSLPDRRIDCEGRATPLLAILATFIFFY